jgi:hypothetical protein
VEILQAERTIPFTAHDQTLQFTVPSIKDYEVAAITIA